ncbi:fungal specific transcription factor [Colletotrichum truncatum]|uniref:Fungal specific transcription factor n=1 Tax=Colletotrichum truncatum TaxID=5467 RepID=A0ACC3ZE18_COLTU|nr:fungal specific transcription factor [Colletotrichum truncatum]KAF6794873.1 fungal specific transcription factor [Colletotrichum truncatum]
MSSRPLQRLAVTPPSEDSDNVNSSSRYTSRVSPASSNHQTTPDAPPRAHRACEKCTRTKKKCDKGLPACSRCTRLATNCCYDFVVNPPLLTVVDHGTFKAAGDVRPVFEWLNQVDFTAAQIMQLLSSRGIDWKASVKIYFCTVNTWLAIIHPDLWQRRCAAAQLDVNPNDVDTALIVLCIHLLTIWNCDEFSSTAMFEHPLYQSAKRIWTLRKAFSRPSIELIQCGVLISLFELGHGDITRCYQTFGEAAAIGKVMNLKPGKYVKEEEDLPADHEDEQRRALWWVLVIMDKISHEQSATLWTPLQMDMPSEDDLLPTEHYLWDNEQNGTIKMCKRYPVTIPASVRVGAFQRSCQAAILLGYAAAWEVASSEQEEPPSVYSFIQLESATRQLIEALITRSETWGENLNTYALCASLFCLLFYSFMYSANRPDAPSRDPETDMEMKKAVAGINFTISLVIDGSKGIFNAYSNREDVLEHCAPVWPYAQYHTMQLLFHYEALLEDAESRMAEVRQSVESTAKRWACSRWLLEEFDRVQAARRSGAQMCKKCTIGSRTCGHCPMPE